MNTKELHKALIFAGKKYGLNTSILEATNKASGKPNMPSQNSELFVSGHKDSVFLKKHGSAKDILIVCFGGLGHELSGLLPFEFLGFLTRHYNTVDKLFYVDAYKYWYHKGIANISTGIDSTTAYLKEKIKDYKKVFFIGTSSGGYASILFGSLLNIDTVIAFIPRTLLDTKEYKNLEPKYIDANKFINPHTKYFLYGDSEISSTDTNHHISQCQRIVHHDNVILSDRRPMNMKKLRDSGELKKITDQFFSLYGGVV